MRGTAETRIAQAKVWGKKVSKNLEKVKTEFDLEVQQATCPLQKTEKVSRAQAKQEAKQQGSRCREKSFHSGITHFG